MTVVFTDHEYIATYHALSRYEKQLSKKAPSARPQDAMLLSATSKAIQTMAASCPVHLLSVLGLPERKEKPPALTEGAGGPNGSAAKKA